MYFNVILNVKYVIFINIFKNKAKKNVTNQISNSYEHLSQTAIHRALADCLASMLGSLNVDRELEKEAGICLVCRGTRRRRNSKLVCLALLTFFC